MRNLLLYHTEDHTLSRLAVPDAVSPEHRAMGMSPSKNLRIRAL